MYKNNMILLKIFPLVSMFLLLNCCPIIFCHTWIYFVTEKQLTIKENWSLDYRINAYEYREQPDFSNCYGGYFDLTLKKPHFGIYIEHNSAKKSMFFARVDSISLMVNGIRNRALGDSVFYDSIAFVGIDSSTFSGALNKQCYGLFIPESISNITLIVYSSFLEKTTKNVSCNTDTFNLSKIKRRRSSIPIGY